MYFASRLNTCEECVLLCLGKKASANKYSHYSLIKIAMKEKEEKPEKHQKKKHTEPKFKFSKYDMEDLYLNSKIPKSLIQDMEVWAKDKDFRRALVHELHSWMLQKNHQKRLIQSAKVAVRVIDKLLISNLPLVVVDVYLSFLCQNSSKVDKYLDYQEADKLFKYIPTSSMINYISLFKLSLSEQEQHSLISELVSETSTCNVNLSRLPALFKNKNHYTDVLIKELISHRKQNVAAQVMKKLKVPKEAFPRIYNNLVQLSAITMHRWSENFTWERLEEVFQHFPAAIAANIRSTYNNKKVNKGLLEGFASICKRIPEVLANIPQKIRDRFRQINNVVPNRLRTDRFEPSNPNQHVSLADFGYSQKSVIWVDESNLTVCLQRISEAKLIGIDTESRVVRTTLDSSLDVLATIQIATNSKVFIFDCIVLKKIKTQLPQVQYFFKNKEVTIVGHTLEADLNEGVTSLLGFRGQLECTSIDICPIFKVLYPGTRPGLASITKTLIGKELCKEFTLTNWERRPLLKNQLHYAALDAVVVIKLWEILREHPEYKDALQKITKNKAERKKQNDQGQKKEETQEQQGQEELEETNEQQLEAAVEQ